MGHISAKRYLGQFDVLVENAVLVFVYVIIEVHLIALCIYIIIYYVYIHMWRWTTRMKIEGQTLNRSKLDTIIGPCAQREFS